MLTCSQIQRKISTFNKIYIMRIHFFFLMLPSSWSEILFSRSSHLTCLVEKSLDVQLYSYHRGRTLVTLAYSFGTVTKIAQNTFLAFTRLVLKLYFAYKRMSCLFLERISFVLYFMRRIRT